MQKRCVLFVAQLLQLVLILGEQSLESQVFSDDGQDFLQQLPLVQTLNARRGEKRRNSTSAVTPNRNFGLTFEEKATEPKTRSAPAASYQRGGLPGRRGRLVNGTQELLAKFPQPKLGASKGEAMRRQISNRSMTLSCQAVGGHELARRKSRSRSNQLKMAASSTNRRLPVSCRVRRPNFLLPCRKYVVDSFFIVCPPLPPRFTPSRSTLPKEPKMAAMSQNGSLAVSCDARFLETFLIKTDMSTKIKTAFVGRILEMLMNWRQVKLENGARAQTKTFPYLR